MLEAMPRRYAATRNIMTLGRKAYVGVFFFLRRLNIQLSPAPCVSPRGYEPAHPFLES